MTDSTVPFSELCKVFQDVSRAKLAVKKKCVRTFLDQVYTGKEYFSVMRLLLPAKDNGRGNYGLKEATLGSSIAEALGLGKESADAKLLVNWRKGGAKSGSNAGNFTFIAAEVLHKRQRVISTGLKIKDVNDLLDRLAVAHKMEERVPIIAEMINKTDSREMRWIIMIILKDLKLGIGEKSIFGQFHPSAQDVYSVTSDLKLVCEKLRNLDRSERYVHPIQVGKHMQPQQAARATDVQEAWTFLHGKEVIVECKLDGYRIQIHKDGTKLIFFTRNSIDDRDIHAAMSDVVLESVLPEKCILDGEMLVWDRRNNCFAEFGANREAAKAERDGVDTGRQMCFIAFDFLYQGNNSVIHLPLRERQELLYKAVRPVKRRLEVIRPDSAQNHEDFSEPTWSFIAKSAKEVEHFFLRCVENREEGIILKDLDSKWEPDDRSRKWLKLKPDYVNSGSDIDALIIGGYYGTGRKGGQVAQFLLGIAEKPKGDEYPSVFRSFCKVGTGLSDEQSDNLVQKLKPYFKRYEKGSQPPKCYIVTNNSKERPDVWVDPPDKSVILEVTSDIRTISTETFAAPCGLRFPRIHRVRYEKPWYDCLDVQTLVDTVNRSVADGETQHPNIQWGQLLHCQ